MYLLLVDKDLVSKTLGRTVSLGGPSLLTEILLAISDI